MTGQQIFDAEIAPDGCHGKPGRSALERGYLHTQYHPLNWLLVCPRCSQKGGRGFGFMAGVMEDVQD